MGTLIAFAPWIAYWILVGNVPFHAAVLVALTIAIGALLIGRVTAGPGRNLEIGAVATFVVLTVLAFALDQDVMERWLQPLSNVGIFLAALIGTLIGKPFVREFAAVGQPAGVLDSDLFRHVTGVLTWIWIATFAAMTVSSMIPPMVQGDATILDTTTVLSFLCYWVIPISLLGLAALASRILPDRMLAGINDIERKTTFVAYSEAAIDELYYLAQQHADKEAGPGQVAYAVKVGGAGSPLTGDESRNSWPMTYKIRDR